MSRNNPSEDDNSSNVESQVITWLNDLAFAEGSDKVVLLRKLHETLIHQCPQLLPTYLDNILSNVSDRLQEVRKSIVGFIEETCKIHVELLPRMVGQLRVLLTDDAISVQKRVIQAANIVYKHALSWICNSPEATEEMESCWELLNELKLSILNMVDSENEGIRTNSIKFLEGIIVLQTYPDEHSEKKPGDFSLEDVPLTLKFARRRKLEEESNHIFDLLLKFHNSEHISGVNLMACMTALCEVSKARPRFLPRVVQALGDLHTTLPPTLSQSQVNSVRKHLKMQVFNVVRHPSSTEMLPQLGQLLLDLGMSSSEIAKIIPRDKRNKRLFDLKNGDGPAKRARIDSPQSNSQSSDRSDVSSFIEAPGEDSQSSAEPPPPSVTEQSILEGLQNLDLVINLVLSTLSNLPDEIPPDFVTHYEPISNSAMILQKPMMAKLLLAIIKGDTGSQSADSANMMEDTKDEEANLQSALAKIESKRLEKKFEGAVSRLMEETKIDTLNRELAREKDILSNLEKEKLICPQTPTVGKLKQRVKTIKLHEVTKPLPRDVKERLLIGAVERILLAERAAQDRGVTAHRDKMLTTFAVSYGSKVREVILAFILEDITIRIDLALSWLFEEYSYVQGFNQMISSKGNEKSAQNYNNVICAMITNISEMGDPSQELQRDMLLRRMYLECPVVTEDAIAFLKQTCSEDGRTHSSLNLLRDLILFQPPKASKFISAMLPLAIHENAVIRDATIEHVLALYNKNNESLRKTIEKHASLYLGFIALPDPPKDLFEYECGRSKTTLRVWTDDLYKICLQLYLALLPINEELLNELWRVYAHAGAEGKRCVLRLLETPIRQLGAECPAVLLLIEECPKGVETLITRIIHILTEKTPPSKELVTRIRDLYTKRVSDVRFLIPVINGLSKEEILEALPKLIKLNPVAVREVFNKLLGNQNEGQEYPVSPSELLVALHLIDSTKAELKYIIKATSLCFAEKHIYTFEVLVTVLEQLVEQPQLPVLLMRSLLQALTLHPTRMAPLALNILQMLISREIWEQKVVWEGFLKCTQRLLPQSLVVLKTLPAHILTSVMETCPDLRQAIDRANNTNNNILAEVPISEDSLPNQIETYSGMDSTDFMMPNEPLPPGMD